MTNDGTPVDLSGYLDNTDAQNLSLSGTTLNISGGAGVDLAILQDGTGTDNQDLDLSGNTLSLTNDGTPVDLSGYLDNTDSQNLTSATLSGNTLTVAIENGSSVNVDLSPILAALEAENTTQQTLIDDLLIRVADLEACACQTLDLNDPGTPRNMGPALYQNIPNPFNDTSTIRYYLPSSVVRASLVFSDVSGKILSNVQLDKRGEQEMIINKRGMKAGMYFYTLFVGAKKIDSKKMIIQ